MLPSLIICIVTCVAMIASILFFPKLKIGKVTLDTYWMITLLGAIVLLCARQADAQTLLSSLTADTAVNPLKILVLFLSMTLLSVFLDELNFFRYLASLALKHARHGQKTLFVSLYLTVSVLTVFTSNDIIILSLTPFLCYFAKNAKISPTPYLAAEFVAANTWSMLLLIGNPTNIYLTTAYGLNFVAYCKISFLPTLCVGLVSFLILLLLFRKHLSAPMEGNAEPVSLEDKLSLWVGIVHLAVCTVLLAIGSYINLELWLVALCSAGSLCLWTLVISLFRREKPTALLKSLKRIPYPLVPFMLSMFVLVSALEQNGETALLGSLLSHGSSPLTYGVASFLMSNIINNIPMSILFSSIIEGANASLGAVFATVFGSNLGAILTPIGALAGIMWRSIAEQHGVKFGYGDFLKMGLTVAVPSLFAAIGGLYASLALFG